MKTKTKTLLHSPVLLNEVLDVLQPKKGENYLDLTAGYGGHASPILNATSNFKESVISDRDPNAIEYLKKKFSLDQPSIIQGTSAEVCRGLLNNRRAFDMILIDLGVSSPHLDNANRGFSILQDGPLDMRMDPSKGKTAADIVNSASSEELQALLRLYGEEPHARKISSAIIATRPLNTTTQLAEVVKAAYERYSKKHPATRTFQALRIAVNDELHLVTNTLPLAVQLLAPGGRLAVISFHSLEDRIVKRYFQELANEGYESEVRLLTTKPLTASSHELSFNPRARSAKLRAVAKIKK